MPPAPFFNLRIAYATPLKLEAYSVLEVKRQRRAVSGAGMQLRGDGWTGTGARRDRSAHPEPPSALLPLDSIRAPASTKNICPPSPAAQEWFLAIPAQSVAHVPP